MKLFNKFKTNIKHFDVLIASVVTGVLATVSAVRAEEVPGEILAPLNRFRFLVIAVVGVVGIIALTVGCARFFTSSNDPHEREAAKKAIAYSIVGLIGIAAAPFFVNYMLGV